MRRDGDGQAAGGQRKLAAVLALLLLFSGGLVMPATGAAVETEADAMRVARSALQQRNFSHEALTATATLKDCNWVVWFSPAAPVRGGGYKVVIESGTGQVLEVLRGQ